MSEKKQTENKVEKSTKNNKAKIIIPIIVVLIALAVVITVVSVKYSKKDNTDIKIPVVVTDQNGVPVTDQNGVPVTYVAETEVVKVTGINGKPIKDNKGEVMTTIIYKDVNVEVNVPVTKENGEIVTEKGGAPVTEKVTMVQKPGENNLPVVVGTTFVPVTKENGEIVTENGGTPVTEKVTVVQRPGENNLPVVGTTFVPVTKENGEIVTENGGTPVTEKVTVVQKPDENNLPVVVGTTSVNVTKENGENVTNKDGENVTENIHVTAKPNIRPDTTGKPVVLSSTAVAVTDGEGNTAQDGNGNIFTTIVELTSNPIPVKPAELSWKTSMGGTEADYFSSVEALNNGGYIASNVTNSTNGDMAEFEKLYFQTPYTILTKYDEGGNVKWRKPIGSQRGLLVITDVLVTKDDEFYAVGYGKNIGGQNGLGYYDGVVYKFDKNGNELWHKVFGTSTVDIFNGGTITSDGGIVAVGSVGNNDGDAAGFGKPQLQSAACIVKYSPKGDLVFKNIIGGNADSLKNVVEGKNGNLYAVGQFLSGNLFEPLGQSDGGVVRFSKAGKYLGTTAIAGKGIDLFTGITACKNGGVVIVGKSNSSDVDDARSLFTSSLAARGGFDSYIIKVSDEGEIAFAKAFRGQYDDDLVSVIEKPDGSLIAVGESNSSTRDFRGITTRGGYDIVIACFSKTGDLSWARSLGGTNNESASSLCLSKKGGYVVAGRTLSKDIDMTGIAQYVNGKSVGVIVKFPE